MADRLYPQLTHEQVLALEPHYSRHVAAMTEEGLFGKAEIAEQLALRDRQIEQFEKAVAVLALTLQKLGTIDRIKELALQVAAELMAMTPKERGLVYAAAKLATKRMTED